MGLVIVWRVLCACADLFLECRISVKFLLNLLGRQPAWVGRDTVIRVIDTLPSRSAHTGVSFVTDGLCSSSPHENVAPLLLLSPSLPFLSLSLSLSLSLPLSLPPFSLSLSLPLPLSPSLPPSLPPSLLQGKYVQRN